MGTRLRFFDFRQQFYSTNQGVFWLESKRWLPDGLFRLNVGLSLSEQLLKDEQQQRKDKVLPHLRDLINGHTTIVLDNIEVLFLPSLKLDVPALMVTLARNRLLLTVWPGEIKGQQLIYGQPASPEYAVYDYTKYTDTYVITR